MRSPSLSQRAKPPVPHIRCLSDPDLLNPEVQAPGKHKSNERLQLAHRALLVVEAPSSRGGRKIKHFLNSLRIDVKVVPKSKTLPPLNNKKSARYAVVVFENYSSYLKLDSWSRQVIDKYCRDYHVGIVGFVRPPREDGSQVTYFDGYHLTLQHRMELEDMKLNFDSYLWRVLRPGEVWKGFLPGKWAVFHSNHSTYQNLAYSRLSSKYLEFEDDEKDSATAGFQFVTAVMDKGEIDGIPKILFGNDLSFWLHTVMMMDTLSYLSFGKLELTLERYIQVDVDDIFVGKKGIRMTVDDVEALVATQDRLQKDVDGFQFNLGYSGGFYLSGNEEEDEGDKRLLGR
ncbi:bifunctional heparan sulfate N-deacetylase/N-sulfotransferase [Elysia marginata]|uniref:Bifunctional heparan sulfate N-deacetylase/N-sulfotransferase n=1 Tax=Elysia marginata TaxID=1093978 RepID=A0AAV4EGY4_9GAST|nr:bifunctional heparan sulfate N-deacetylase/N-sulfotransferase [Elysia marginata]